MSTKPASADCDKELFRGCPKEVRDLALQSRKELRAVKRAEYARMSGLKRAGGL